MTRAGAFALAIGYALALLALTAARPQGAAGPTMRDFEAYYCAGQTWNAHADPYGRDIWSCERSVPGVDGSHDELLPFAGPPPLLPFLGAVARLPYAAASIAWYALLVASAAALVLASLRLSGTRLSATALLALPLLVVGFAPLTSDLALGQIALVAAACAAAAAQSRGAQRIVSLTGAALQPNVGSAAGALIRDARALLMLAGAAAMTYALGALAAGPGWPLAYAAILARHAGSEATAVIQHTPRAVAWAFGASPGAASALALVAAVAVVVAVVGVASRDRSDGAAFAAACAGVPFLSGFFHEHDFVIALPAVAFVLARRPRCVASVVACAFVAIDWLGLAQRPEAALQAALLAFAFLLALITVLGLEFQQTVPAAILISLVFACAAAVGTAHPLTVWPASLGAYHAPPDASASAVWLREQQLTGQTGRSPATAILRALPLAGALVLLILVALPPDRATTRRDGSAAA